MIILIIMLVLTLCACKSDQGATVSQQGGEATSPNENNTQDFNVFTYNILPNAFGKKVIEKFYKQIDAKLEVKGIGLHR